MNKFRLKYLPKIGKRDKATLAKRVYTASINGHVSEFSNKLDLISYLDTYRHHFNEIGELSVCRVDIYSLDDFKY